MLRNEEIEVKFLNDMQRMVVSISSDRTVWDAVMKNTEVQEFRQSFHQGKLADSVT